MSIISEEYVKKLNEHIIRSLINHDINIMQESSLKNAHIYCLVNGISAQQYGPLIEKYIRVKNNFTKNDSKNCNGDICKNNENVEIKASLGGSGNNKFNWVQLRVSHNIQYYILTAYHLDTENVNNGGNLYIFKVPKDDMTQLIATYGGYAHGTKKEFGNVTLESVTESDNKKEYAIRPIFGSKCWQDFMKYKIDETSI
jgi:hypothetical protein